MILTSGVFENYTDSGRTLVSINRDGTISHSNGQLPVIHGFKTIHITTAQILNMATSPVSLLPGIPGYLVDIRGCFLRYNFGGTAFNAVAGDFLSLLTGINGPGGSGMVSYPGGITASGLVNKTVDSGAFMDSWWGGGFYNGANHGFNAPLASIIGKGASLFQYNSGHFFTFNNNWTLGNGSLDVYLDYEYLFA